MKTLGVVDDDAVVEYPVELFVVDPVGSLDLAVQSGCGRIDVDVAYAAVEDVPMELGLELGTVVGLDRLDLERELLEDVIEELDRALLVVAVIDAQHSWPGAVIDRGVLVVRLHSGACDGFDELDVDLHEMAGEWLFVAFPASVVGLVPLVGRQPLRSRRLRIRQKPDGEIVTSWYRAKYIEIFDGPKW